MNQQRIIEDVEDQTGVPYAEICSKQKGVPAIQAARRLLCYELWRKLKMKHKAIAKVVNRERSTVVSLIQTAWQERQKQA